MRMHNGDSTENSGIRLLLAALSLTLIGAALLWWREVRFSKRPAVATLISSLGARWHQLLFRSYLYKLAPHVGTRPGLKPRSRRWSAQSVGRSNLHEYLRSMPSGSSPFRVRCADVRREVIQGQALRTRPAFCRANMLSLQGDAAGRRQLSALFSVVKE